MKILHTSDWHVGRTLYRQSRMEESRAVLEEIAGIAERETVDLVLVAGDVFEQRSPSPEAEQVVYDVLLRLARAGIPVVVVVGNHDHPRRWHALAPLFRKFDIHVVDEPRRPDDGGVVAIDSRDRSERLQIAALPWVSERSIVYGSHLMAGQTHQVYADGLRAAIGSICSGFDSGCCTMLAAHLYLSGVAPAGSERPLTIGETYAVDPSAVPHTVQYAALGHIHALREGSGLANWRYSGAPLQMDFGEAGSDKYVLLVELHPNLPASFQAVPLTSGRRLRDLAGSFDELETLTGAVGDDYLRVILRCDAPRVGLGDAVRELFPNALTVRLDTPAQAAGEDVVELGSKAPRELFAEYLAYMRGEPDPHVLEVFDELYRQMTEPEPAGQLSFDSATG
jgi:exonuclease SbcD